MLMLSNDTLYMASLSFFFFVLKHIFESQNDGMRMFNRFFKSYVLTFFSCAFFEYVYMNVKKNSNQIMLCAPYFVFCVGSCGCSTTLNGKTKILWIFLSECVRIYNQCHTHQI